jgi:hypothetical protein
MADLTTMGYIPENGLKDKTEFPALPGSEDEARAQIQGMFDQVKDYINDTLLAELKSAASPSGAEKIGSTAIDDVDGATVWAQLSDLKNQIDEQSEEVAAALTNGLSLSQIIEPGDINGSMIADDSIDSRHYIDGSIDGIHLSDDCIDGTKICDACIDSEHYVSGSIDSEHIADGAVTETKIASLSVITAKINNGAVTSVKIADGNVTAAKIADGCISAVKIADGSVITSKIYDGNVTEAKLASSAVTLAKLAPSALAVTPRLDSGTSISSSANLNSYTGYGTYYSSSTTAATLSNCPVTDRFRMIVSQVLSDATYTIQTIKTYAGVVYERYTANSGSSWSAWRHESNEWISIYTSGKLSTGEITFALSASMEGYSEAMFLITGNSSDSNTVRASITLPLNSGTIPFNNCIVVVERSASLYRPRKITINSFTSITLSSTSDTDDEYLYIYLR